MSFRVAERVSGVQLSSGAHPLPDSEDRLYRLLARAFSATREGDVYRLRGVPPGRYTVVVLRVVEEDFTEAHIEEVELEAGGDKTWVVSPRWIRYEDR